MGVVCRCTLHCLRRMGIDRVRTSTRRRLKKGGNCIGKVGEGEGGRGFVLCM